MPDFALILSRTPKMEFVLTAAISGENDRWRGSSRPYSSLRVVEGALREAGVIAPLGADQRIDAVNGGVTVAFFADATSVVALQLLSRVDPQKAKERTFMRFHDRRAGVLDITQEYWLDRPPLTGDLFTINTPLGSRTAALRAITRSEVKMFGSEETRREVDADVEL